MAPTFASLLNSEESAKVALSIVLSLKLAKVGATFVTQPGHADPKLAKVTLKTDESGAHFRHFVELAVAAPLPLQSLNMLTPNWRK